MKSETTGGPGTQEHRGITVEKIRSSADSPTLGEVERMFKSDDLAERARGQQLWDEAMGPAMAKLRGFTTAAVPAGLFSQMARIPHDALANNGTLQVLKTVTDRQADITSMLRSPALEALKAKPVTLPNAPNHSAATATAAANTAEAVSRLIVVAEAQNDELGTMTEVLRRLVEDVESGQRGQTRRERLTIALAGLAVIVGAVAMFVRP